LRAFYCLRINPVCAANAYFPASLKSATPYFRYHAVAARFAISFANHAVSANTRRQGDA
jgi:hypothetical protein